LYSINSYRFQLGYIWKESAQKEHTLNPIAINYVQPLAIEDSFKNALAKNPLLRRVVDTQFIVGSNYNYTYNELVNNEKFGAGWYFNGLLDLSGNIAGLVSGANVKQGKEVRLFGSPFSQYFKTELDLRRYLKIGLKGQWANRLIVGVGIPYGNSTRLPFVKQFFAGGSNSLRGFRSRSVGPGIYDARKAAETQKLAFLPDITGDIKLEFNTEIRRNLVSIFDGALFFDAGNVWMANEDPNALGGKFSKNFIKELAMDAGVGLRIDVTILLLRLDVAIPLKKPWLPGNQQNFNLGKDIIYNLAIGMPF
jgi:outer membrane protein assembly factor BamA